MTLSKWLRQAAVDDGEKPGVARSESAENRELKKRIQLLEQKNEGPCPKARSWLNPGVPVGVAT
ncbi:hypothetical protein [Streptomyces sp. NPDC002403]